MQTLWLMTRQPMLFQNAYLWYVLVSALDLLLTWIILHLGGREVNVLAAMVIARGGLQALVIYKFALVAFVIFLCEVIGRQRPATGRALAQVAVALTCVPVAISVVLLLNHR